MRKYSFSLTPKSGASSTSSANKSKWDLTLFPEIQWLVIDVLVTVACNLVIDFADTQAEIDTPPANPLRVTEPLSTGWQQITLLVNPAMRFGGAWVDGSSGNYEIGVGGWT